MEIRLDALCCRVEQSRFGLSLADENECDTGAMCDASAVCANNVGSYTCVCPVGYIMTAEGKCQGKSFSPFLGSLWFLNDGEPELTTDQEKYDHRKLLCSVSTAMWWHSWYILMGSV